MIQPFVFNFQSDDSSPFLSIWEDVQNLNDWTAFNFDFILVGFVAAGAKLLTEWYTKQAENQQLERQKLQTDLQLLKLQLNPDLLFGSLNTLHRLTQQRDKQAPEVVLNLAHLLRYVLYESQADRVALAQEIEVIHQYVFLQKIMAAVPTDVSFTVRGDVYKHTIAPMILLPVVEAAFRRLAFDSDELQWLSIDLAVTPNQLILKVVNGKLDNQPDTPDNLADLEKPLAFHYPNQYSLRFFSQLEADIVALTISFTTNLTDSSLIPSPHETTLLIGGR